MNSEGGNITSTGGLILLLKVAGGRRAALQGLESRAWAGASNLIVIESKTLKITTRML